MRNLLTQAEEKISVFVYTIMLIITFINIVGRYFFSSSISFTEEITTNLFVLISVIGTGIAARSRAHLGLSALTDLFPQKAQHIISCFGNLMGSTFAIVLLVTGIQMVQTQIAINAKTITLLWPAWIYGIFLPIGATFIFLRFLGAAIEDFKKARNHDSDNEAVR